MWFSSVIFLALSSCALVVWAENQTTHKSISNSIENLADKQNEEDPHMKLYKKMHSYLIRTKVYKHYTFEDTIRHVKEGDDWEPTKELQEKFPYYLSGYDYDSQPVWVVEWGKFNYREQIEKGPEATRNLTLYLYQAVHRVIESMIAKDTPENEIRGVFLLGDCEGLDVFQVAHLPTMSFVLNLLQTYTDFMALMLGHAVFFNMNFVATSLFNAFRPIVGGIFDKVELYGTNKAKWMAALRNSLPPEVIPTWYGGSKDYTPVQVYGR